MNKKYLLDDQNLNKIKTRLDRVDNILLFLDYDGTLAPFKTDPLSAFALAEIEESLKKLQKNQKYHLSLVSGRKLSELEKMIELEDCNYAGSHGLEIEFAFDNGIIFPYNTEDIDIMSKKIFEKAKKEYSKSAEIKVEDKGFGIALHFDSDNKLSREKLKLEALFENSDYQVLKGRKIVEIRPAAWDKAKAVEFMRAKIEKEFNLKESLAIYIGDDSTDEDVFRDLENGITIYVQNNSDLKTAAEYYLKNPEDTASFLKELAED